MVPLVGYLDRLSARPGETIAVKVSSRAGEPYAVDMVRIIHADPNPAGPGMKLEDVDCGFAGQYPSRAQAVHPGSFAVVDAALAVPEGGAVRVRVQPGLLDAPQPVLALGGTVLQVSAEGARLAVDGTVAAAVAAPMLERCWYELTAVFGSGRVHLRQAALARSWGVADSGEAEGGAGLPGGDRLFMAADAAGGRFDGRIEDPALLGARRRGRGVMGFFGRHRHGCGPRHASGSPGEPADARGARVAVDGRGDGLEARAAGVRGDSFPCRRPV